MIQNKRSRSAGHWRVRFRAACLLLSVASGSLGCPQRGNAEPGATPTRHGIYDDCLALTAGDVRVVVAASGGRVLEFSIAGRNSLFVSPHDAGKTSKDHSHSWSSDPSGGRFDVGPETITPHRPETWLGDWQLSVAGFAIRAVSPVAKTAGFRLERRIELRTDPVRLRCHQRIINVSEATIHCCHWSRTLANGSGRLLIPLDDHQQFPMRYVRYERGTLITRPRDPAVIDHGDHLELTGPPQSPKLAFDSMAGWVAHLQDTGLLFVKVYDVDPLRRYGEIAGFPLATWTPPSGETIEIEPIGPMESIPPGGVAGYTEDWYLWQTDQALGDCVTFEQIKSLVQPLLRDLKNTDS